MCVCGECPARMSGDQRDSGNLKTSVFLYPVPNNCPTHTHTHTHMYAHVY